LFSALLIQQPLTDHRSFLRNYPSTFTTDEAVECLSHLEFTHLVSTPNPLDQSQPLLTRTTTTFSMSKNMAKTLGQHFLNARLAESATDPQNRTLKDRSIWTPTPKGKFMVQDFSQRARVSIQHMQTSLNRIPNFQIVMFERLIGDDQLSFSRSNMTQAFRVMMEWLPTDNIMIDEIGGLDNKSIIDSYTDAFYGYQCFEWIMEYTSVVSNEESEAIAAEFVLYGWIQQVFDKSDKGQCKKDATAVFKTGRKTQYYLTNKGRSVLDVKSNSTNQSQAPNGTLSVATRSRTQSSTSSISSSSSKDSAKTLTDVAITSFHEELDKLKVSAAPISNVSEQQCSSQNSRLQNILQDPLTRLYFRRFLKSSFCEENVNFWVDYTSLVKKISLPNESCESLLVHCSTIYNTYFCPQNAPSELNIDHGLRHEIIKYMQATFKPCPKIHKNIRNNLTSAVRVDAPFGSVSVSTHGILTSSVARSDDGNGGTISVMKEGLEDSSQQCLYKITCLYSLANEHICKIMAQDSVPRFIRTDKYRDLMQTYYQQSLSLDQNN
ncbi:uncharacterized protein EV154DRAFT_431205, partial [Mucor mucedo]|uniref:uncharacterized protein n=1 Tax=Mucor mucedo TaxID=29922 RepID=UPI00221F2EE3